MKHLRLFESKSKLSIYDVDFTGGSDGVTALYINGKLYKYGDYYHDKMSNWVVGFLEGIRYSGIEYTLKKVECKPELVVEVSENGGIPSKNLIDVLNDSDLDPLSGVPH